MKWPWSRNDGGCSETDEADAHLARIHNQQNEVNKLTSDLEGAQRRNHFSEMVEIAFIRKREV